MKDSGSRCGAGERELQLHLVPRQGLHLHVLQLQGRIGGQRTRSRQYQARQHRERGEGWPWPRRRVPARANRRRHPMPLAPGILLLA
ncbi:MAG: hypothetical protein M5U09_25215 [Gammaproteobacteria bacterium]|nr:hypothetical protein [Gammaproteobacteria bacterium]